MTNLLDLYELALPLMLKGLLITLQISISSLTIGGILGIVLGTVNSKALRPPIVGSLIDAYVTAIRGTPLFVQVLIAYFGLPAVLGYNLSPVQAGILALSLNSAAYLSEIIRGGINAIPKGQWDACKALGYSKTKTLGYIILPQVGWNITPSIINEMISLVKESSILMVIGVPELTKVSKDFVAHELKPMEIYLLCAILYLLITSLLHFTGRLFERKKPWKC